MLTAKEVEALESWTSTKTKYPFEMVFKQLEVVRTKVIQSKRELDEVHSLQTDPKSLPEKLDKIYHNQHEWHGEKIKCVDNALFKEDMYSNIRQWINKTTESQETHVPVSDPSM